MAGLMERLRPYLLSIALHAGLVILIVVLGAQNWHRSPPEPVALAIEAVVVDGKEFRQLSRSRPAPPPQAEPDPEPVSEPLREPEPSPEPAAEVESPPPPPKPDPAKRAAETKRVVEAKQREAEAKRAADAKREAEAKRQAEAKRLADELAAEERRRSEDARIRQEREQALQRALADELAEAEAAEARRVAAARAASLSAQWAAAIQARVQRAWIRPPSARAGLDCRVAVTQAPGGTVLRAEVKECNGDEAVRQSLEAAVFRASPLPPPPEPSLFERNIDLRFRPND